MATDLKRKRKGRSLGIDKNARLCSNSIHASKAAMQSLQSGKGNSPTLDKGIELVYSSIHQVVKLLSVDKRSDLILSGSRA